MKKYFIRETEEPVELGDTIDLTCTKEIEDGKVTVTKKVCLTEDTLPILIELEIVEEREEEDLNIPHIDFGEQDFDEAWQELLEEVEDHDKRIEVLEHAVKTLSEIITIGTKKEGLPKGKNSKSVKIK